MIRQPWPPGDTPEAREARKADLRRWADRLWPCRHPRHSDVLKQYGGLCGACGRVAPNYVIHLVHQWQVIVFAPTIAQVGPQLYVATGKCLYVKDPAEEDIRPISMEDEGIVIDPAQQYWVDALEGDVNG